MYFKKKDKTMLMEAINYADILSSSQKNALSVICSSKNSMSAKRIEDKLGSSKQTINLCLKSLMKRNFIERSRDGVFMYTPNQERVNELINRYQNYIKEKIN